MNVSIHINAFPNNVTSPFRYPLKPYLLTPVLETQNESEEAYNRCFCATRATIERAFGVLKARFRYCNVFVTKRFITERGYVK